MAHKKIFIMNGHPGETSLSRGFTEAYRESAQSAGYDVRMMQLHNMQFDPDYGQGGYKDPKPLEPDLEAFISNVEWTDHMVLSFPMWWGGMPAKLKGAFDRAFLPGRAFDTRNVKWTGEPSPMLQGRTARLIITSDSPGWYMRLRYHNAILWQVGGQIFKFAGFARPKTTWLSGASDPKPGQVDAWTRQVAALGKTGR